VQQLLSVWNRRISVHAFAVRFALFIIRRFAKNSLLIPPRAWPPVSPPSPISPSIVAPNKHRSREASHSAHLKCCSWPARQNAGLVICFLLLRCTTCVSRTSVAASHTGPCLSSHHPVKSLPTRPSEVSPLAQLANLPYRRPTLLLSPAQAPPSLQLKTNRMPEKLFSNLPPASTSIASPSWMASTQ
jgi:hypothetical protein